MRELRIHDLICLLGLLAVGCGEDGGAGDDAADQGQGARANVFDHSPDAELTFVARSLRGLDDGDRLDGEYVSVTSLRVDDELNETELRFATPDEHGDYLLVPKEPSVEDGFAEVNAYYHADLAARWFHDRFDHRTDRVTVRVNLDGAGASSAGTEIRLGQGDTDFAYDPDVIYHELTHLVVGELALLLGGGLDEQGSHGDPHALNEAFADYFAATIAGSPEIGEYHARGEEDGPTIPVSRRIDGDARWPDGLLGEPHVDGLIWSSTLWQIRDEVGSECADAIAFGTIVDLPDFATMNVAAETLLARVEVECPDRAVDILAIVETRGLLSTARVVDLAPDGTPRSGMLGGFGPGTSPVQYRLVLPAESDRIDLDVAIAVFDHASETFEPGNSQQRFVIRRGAPVTVRANELPEDDFDTPVLAFDADSIGTPGERSTVLSRRDGDDAGAIVYYVLLFNQSRTDVSDEEFVHYQLTATLPP